jgi:hypothetical protein
LQVEKIPIFFGFVFQKKFVRNKMNKVKLRLFVFTAMICGVFFLTNCSSTPQTNGNTAVVVNKTTNTATTNTGTTTTTTNTTTTTTETADKVGVPECDEYIQKYEACINSKVPEAQRGMYKSSFETMRKSWKDAAANPQGKAALATGCKQALDTAKQTLSAYSCAW